VTALLSKERFGVMGPWVVLVLLLLPTFAMAAVVQKVAGPDQSEVSHASSGGEIGRAHV
jgi:hypothetical protein